jgi:hypothetical protein
MHVPADGHRMHQCADMVLCEAMAARLWIVVHLAAAYLPIAGLLALDISRPNMVLEGVARLSYTFREVGVHSCAVQNGTCAVPPRAKGFQGPLVLLR